MDRAIAMPTFRVTQKLAKVLKVKLAPEPAGEPAMHWYADLFYVGGKKVVIWTHGATLLSFVKPAVTAVKLRAFGDLFFDQLNWALAGMDLHPVLVDLLGASEPESFARTANRAVVGTMLDCRFLLEHTARSDGGIERVNLAEFNAFLNRTPMGAIGMERPLDRVQALLHQRNGRLAAVRAALEDGERSGMAEGYSVKRVLKGLEPNRSDT